ncbi:MAG: hypothetical protein E7320_00920 [Clostridiales bacterium]|nr:hypothetical protein [Clostridiales bacterium]
MARKTSPFTALTSEQKQLKWMEYQSIRLPYTEAELTGHEHTRENTTPAPTAQAAQTSQPCHATETRNEMPMPPHEERPSRPQPPPEVFVQRRPAAPSAPADYTAQEKTRHRQYDAVIARMKQAELRTGSYRSLSK